MSTNSWLYNESTNLPIINLERVDNDSTHQQQQQKKQIKTLSMLEENLSEFDKGNNAAANTPKSMSDVKQFRSSSMVTGADASLIPSNVGSRLRSGSLFLPNQCIHCRMLDEISLAASETTSGVTSGVAASTAQYGVQLSVVGNVSDEDDCSSSGAISSSLMYPSREESCTSSRSSSISGIETDQSARSSLSNDENIALHACPRREFGQFLEVPTWKPRSSSLDSGIYKNDQLCSSDSENILPEKSRATSVDVHIDLEDLDFTPGLPVRKHSKTNSEKRKFSIVSVSSKRTISRVVHRLRTSRLGLINSRSTYKDYCSKWKKSAKSREHIWYPSTSVRQKCNVLGCKECNEKELFKCSVCKVTSCSKCQLTVENTCKRTFFWKSNNDVTISTDKRVLQHHWIHKQQHKGFCKSCSKNIPSQSIFNKVPVCIQCSWCKYCYHNKKCCFTYDVFLGCCTLGSLRDLILHPSCITRCRIIDKEDPLIAYNEDNFLYNAFKITNYILPSSTTSQTPILAFINPKSGGRQGLDVINQLQWILNPRQVIDITQMSPLQVLKLYWNIKNLKIIVAGGDGSVNWVLRSIEVLAGIPPKVTLPPLAILPLGTGNDLSRELGWGSAYNRKFNLLRFLSDIEKGSIINIDIWNIQTIALSSTTLSSLSSSSSSSLSLSELPASSALGKSTKKSKCDKNSNSDDLKKKKPKLLPLQKFNNYFSLGADAATTLEFHKNREKSPHRFNSRLRNKLCYVELGGKDLFRREYKNMVNYISLKCDGVSYDKLLSQLRPHCILVLNISNYCSGTNPWGKGCSNSISSSKDCGSIGDGSGSAFIPQSVNDKYLEVIGLSASSLATLHMGGQGDRICQCRIVELKIEQDIPIQTDGEPSILKPCTLQIDHAYQYPFISKL